MQKKLIIFLIIIIFLSACTLTQATSTIPATASPLPTATATSTSRPTALWISDAVPDTLREIAEGKVGLADQYAAEMEALAAVEDARPPQDFFERRNDEE